MSIDNPQYDVAISFLSEDQTTAAAIYSKLSGGLKIFCYPRNQEELAGTDGLESMREPFFDSRVMVVLYREKWGKTPWTRVENGGEGGIRTHGRISPTHAFQACSLNRSDTSPHASRNEPNQFSRILLAAHRPQQLLDEKLLLGSPKLESPAILSPHRVAAHF